MGLDCELLEDQESWGKVIGANLIQLKSIVPLVPFCVSKKDNAHKKPRSLCERGFL